MKIRKKAARRIPRSASAKKLVLEARSLQAQTINSRVIVDARLVVVSVDGEMA